MPITDPIIETVNLTHNYGARVALHELTLSIHPAESFALLGPNGSGKTTLFRILSTLIPPMDGRVTILGFDLAKEREKVRPHIGVIFQSPSLDRQLTAEENLTYHGHLYGLTGAPLGARVRDLLQRVDLLDRARERIATFSGGMRRRVELAKCLIHQPRILLLDEPSTGLDPVARSELWNTLERVRARDNVTVVLTTHLMDEADRCDRVAILDQGKLVAADTPANLKSRVGGDVITLSTKDPQTAKELLSRKLGIEAEMIGNALRFERPSAHQLVPQVIESLPGLVDSIQVGKPTLEDVFISATGHGFRDD